MALKPLKDYKHKLTYPLYIQPKLDGLRMIAMLDSKGKVVLKTRRLHDISKFDQLKEQLQSLYDTFDDKDLILDGELYAHGMDLQIISGIVRDEKDEDDKKNQLQYWTFDCFSTKDDSVPFERRIEKLKQFVKDTTPLVVINETHLIQTEKESDAFYEKVVSDGFEGIIYKSRGKPYDYSFDKEKRSMWYLKRKQVFDDEYEIVSYSSGNGKDADCVIFVLKTKEGNEFNSVPNGTYDYRKELYQKCLDNFDQFKGKLAKVQYEDLSSDGVPLRNRMVAFRDLSFD
jgi:ATP-dependent DNA ligase